MKNLFVLHTQYNLILTYGLLKNKFQNDENDLILFKDFEINTEMKNRIDTQFQRVLYLSGSYPKSNEKYIKKVFRYKKIINSIKKFIGEKYDRVIVVDDYCIPEMYIMKLSYKQNKYTQYEWLEDGSIAYFNNSYVFNGFSKNNLTKFLRKFIFKYLCFLGKFYDYNLCMGTHYLCKTAYITFPRFLRIEHSGKNIIEISNKMFKDGLNIYADDKKIDIRGKSAIFIMDLLSVYEKDDDVDKMLLEVIEFFKKKNISIYYKYHPREEDKFGIFNEYVEIDKKLAIENIFSKLDSKEIIIVGIKSTVLQNSIKSDYLTVSLIEMIGGDRNIIEFYKKIGVVVPNSINELNKLLVEKKF